MEKENKKIDENKSQIKNLQNEIKSQKIEIDNINQELKASNQKRELLTKTLNEVITENKKQMKYMEDLQNKIMEVMKKIALKKNISLE
jgi:septal ring factor EnvC (AmiA/AmiB activator)